MWTVAIERERTLDLLDLLCLRGDKPLIQMAVSSRSPRICPPFHSDQPALFSLRHSAENQKFRTMPSLSSFAEDAPPVRCSTDPRSSVEEEITITVPDELHAAKPDENAEEPTPDSLPPDPKLRFIDSDVLTIDRNLATQQDDAFNLFFYDKCRKLTRHEPAVKKPTRVTVWRNDPLEHDPYKNPLASVIKSIKPGSSTTEVKVRFKERKLPILPIPETILPENPKNVLRFKEASCWDFANGVLSMELPPVLPSGEENLERPVSSDEDLEKPGFSWICHGDFDVERGAQNLQEFFAKEWRRDPAWRVYIQVHDRKYKPGNVTAYVYETCWSIPTRKQPVPAATASIYFTIDVCTSKRPTAPVIVSCHFENSPMILDPLKINFGGEILKDIMERKQILASKLIY